MTINKKYAKLENGALIYAPTPLIINDEPVWTNDESIYLEQGYYNVVLTDKPVKEGYYYTSYWEIEGSNIVQKWEEHEKIVIPPIEPDPTADQVLNVLLGV